MARPTQFQKLSGSYLVMTARVTCRACFEVGLRGAVAQVIDPMLCPSYGGPLSSRWHSTIVRAAKKHYRQKHPEVKLPV